MTRGLTFVLDNTWRTSLTPGKKGPSFSDKISQNDKLTFFFRHNFHQYFQFFKNLREAINHDNYENFKNEYLEW